ncbi:MAG: pyridoxal phosphate-dependent class II aminotransferase [Lachnospiraceae bacterium]|nr:pyridoxal phosphate-dependent class II aminotransferase [Lachnospiraceae bacterium]
MYQHGGDIYHHVNCLDFSANINFLGIPEKMKQALHDSIEECVNYPDVHMTALKQALARKEGVKEANIICGAGAADLIFRSVQAIKPKKALLLAPGFQEYEQALNTVDCDLEFYYLTEANGFKTLPDLLERLDESLDMVFICNPHNPTGLITDKTLIRAIMDRCEEKNIFLMLDECFLDLTEHPEAETQLPELDRYPHLVILKALTKMYAIPGIRMGYAFTSNEALIATMTERAQAWPVSHPAQKAGESAADLGDFEAKSREAAARERHFLKNELAKRGIVTYDSRANYIFLHTKPDFAEAMLARQILVRDCSNYRGLEKGYFRIAVKNHDDNKTLLAAIDEWLGGGQ